MQNRIIYKLFVLSLFILLASLIGCGGGGGGTGGGGGGNATVRGRILRAESNTRPDPVATITVGSASTMSSAGDGSFTLNNVDASQTMLTIAAQGAQTRTLTVALQASQTLDLGDLYISDTGYNATVIGQVVTNANNQQQGVAGVTVTIAGVTVTTGQNGAFTIAGLPVGLGSVAGAVVGRATATGFEVKDITSETLEFPLTAGNNQLRNPIVILPPSGSVPLPPHTITGGVLVNGTGRAGAVVTLRSATVLLTTTTDNNGQYFFWVVPGTYTVTATFQTASGQSTVTLERLDTPKVAPTINLVL